MLFLISTIMCCMSVLHDDIVERYHIYSKNTFHYNKTNVLILYERIAILMFHILFILSDISRMHYLLTYEPCFFFFYVSFIHL